MVTVKFGESSKPQKNQINGLYGLIVNLKGGVIK